MAQESLEQIVVGEVVEDIVEKQTKLEIADIVEEAVREEKEREDQQAFKIEAERAFVDQAIF